MDFGSPVCLILPNTLMLQWDYNRQFQTPAQFITKPALISHLIFLKSEKFFQKSPNKLLSVGMIALKLKTRPFDKNEILQLQEILQSNIKMENQNTKKLKERVVTQVDDFGRKKFALRQQDPSDNQNQDKDHALINTGKYRSTLIGRQEKIDTDKFIGKIENNKKKKKTEVFYCEVCKQGFKCDIAYITHLNSPSHNSKLGMNMKVKASSKESVAEKLKRMQEEKRLGMNKKEAKIAKILQKQMLKSEQIQKRDMEQNLKEKVEVEVGLMKEEQNDEIKQQKEREQEEQNQVDENEELMKQCLGFSSFGSKKQKY